MDQCSMHLGSGGRDAGKVHPLRLQALFAIAVQKDLHVGTFDAERPS